MQFDELVMRRRTVRRFRDEPVDRTVLERIAQLAQRTPSAGFSQGQRLVIVTEPEDEQDWPTPYWWVDIGKTSMLAMLAAHDAGLAAGFAGPQDVPALRAVLDIPDEFHPIGVIPIGYPLPDVRSPSLKRGWLPLDEFAHWERW
jgi:nitroreductase